MPSRKATPTKPASPKPGHGNPYWRNSYVTASHVRNWNPRGRKLMRKDATSPLTISAGPGPEAKRVNVSLAESGQFMTDTVAMLDLSIGFHSAVRGRVTLFGEMTVCQALSFEEAVRAVFEAAREEGVLPPLTESGW